MAGRRSARHGQDAPRPCKSHPEGVGKHDDPGPPDSHRHEPQEAGCRSDTVSLLDHRSARSPTKPGVSLKRLLQQPPGDCLPDEGASMAVPNAASSAKSASELTSKRWKSELPSLAPATLVTRLCYLNCSTSSRPGERSPASSPMVPSTPARATMPSRPEARSRSFRPARTPSPGRPTPRAQSPATKPCAHHAVSVEPSGDDGAATTAGAAPKQRCTA